MATISDYLNEKTIHMFNQSPSPSYIDIQTGMPSHLDKSGIKAIWDEKAWKLNRQESFGRGKWVIKEYENLGGNEEYLVITNIETGITWWRDLKIQITHQE